MGILKSFFAPWTSPEAVKLYATYQENHHQERTLKINKGAEVAIAGASFGFDPNAAGIARSNAVTAGFQNAGEALSNIFGNSNQSGAPYGSGQAGLTSPTTIILIGVVIVGMFMFIFSTKRKNKI